VYLRAAENARGEAVISREMARREEAWDRLEKAYADDERVEGAIFGRVKGGFTVDLGGAVAFLPGSQVDVRPVRDAGPLMGLKQPFQILKMDRRRGNIVVSRRAILEESRAEQRAEVIGKLSEGDVVDGVVKNITEYGAFVDLGGVDGLLHVTDMAWRRVNHPSEILSIGETVKVQVIKINKETHRISLGMKQLQEDPWDLVARYPLGSVHKGRVTNITDYGAFVELEPGVEGLVHVSEMSWTKKNVHPGKIVSTSQEVEVMVLEIDPPSAACRWVSSRPCATRGKSSRTIPRAPRSRARSRTSPSSVCSSVSTATSTAWSTFPTSLGRARRGRDPELPQGRHGQGRGHRGRHREGAYLASIKALGGDKFAEAIGGVKRGSIITVEVTAIEDGGIEVEYEGMKSFIRRSDLSRDRAEQRPERFQVGDKVDVRVTNVDRRSRRLGLSIKAREIAEEKEAVEQYGSSDSGHRWAISSARRSSMLCKIGDVEIWRILDWHGLFRIAGGVVPQRARGRGAHRRGSRSGQRRHRDGAADPAGAGVPAEGVRCHDPDRRLYRQSQDQSGSTDWAGRDDDRFLAGLTAAGVTPADVDVVFCTHLHVDHFGWNTRLENGRNGSRPSPTRATCFPPKTTITTARPRGDVYRKRPSRDRRRSGRTRQRRPRDRHGYHPLARRRGIRRGIPRS
jgi:small subunit ribosomal protein S1